MILSTAQAEAVINAMAQINNVGGSIGRIDLPGSGFITGDYRGAIRVSGMDADEEYVNQAAFRDAYGLN